jgi:hypothetical protein
LEPYRRAFAEFLAAVNPQLISAEDVAWSDAHNYAGSFDAILRVWLLRGNEPDASRQHGEACDLIVDYKTSAGTYPEVALQLSAYAHADRLITPDGASRRMPDVDGGAVLHVAADGSWEFRPVLVDERVHRYFLALREAFDWDREVSKEVLSKPIAQSEPDALVTGTQRRAK